MHMYGILTDNIQFLEIISIACSCLYSHPHAAAQSELAEVKQLNQVQVFEKEKLKLKLEKSQTSSVKVGSLMVIFVLSLGVFIEPVRIS